MLQHDITLNDLQELCLSEPVFFFFRPACPSSLFHTWEALLQEVEIDSQVIENLIKVNEEQNLLITAHHQII